MSTWTDAVKKEVIEEYTSQNPTSENTIDILTSVAENHTVSVNGLRRILSIAEVYVPKGKTTATTKDSDKPKRKSKQESLDELTTIMTEQGIEVETDIVNKLTGKAADFFTGAFKHIITG